MTLGGPGGHDRSLAVVPVWVELSGLPLHLHKLGKGPAAWTVLRALMALDVAANPLRPGHFEVTLDALAERAGIPANKLGKAVGVLRKAALVRAFLPEDTAEPALFQLITPLATPNPPDAVRARHGDLFLEGEWPPRYSVAIADEPNDTTTRPDARIKRVVELYLSIFSMKINSLILDQLQLISDRYDIALVERVFETARREGASSLGWVLREIRRESKAREQQATLRATGAHHEDDSGRLTSI